MNTSKIGSANIAKGDYLILSTEQSLSLEVFEKLKQQLEDVLPDNKIIILTSGMKLSKITREDMSALLERNPPTPPVPRELHFK